MRDDKIRRAGPKDENRNRVDFMVLEKREDGNRKSWRQKKVKDNERRA